MAATGHSPVNERDLHQAEYRAIPAVLRSSAPYHFFCDYKVTPRISMATRVTLTLLVGPLGLRAVGNLADGQVSRRPRPGTAAVKEESPGKPLPAADLAPNREVRPTGLISRRLISPQ